MSKPLTFLPEVPQDIEQARDWYAERNPLIAARFLAVLESVLETIEDHPQRGGFYDDRRLYRYRQLIKFPFIVAYREYDDHTLIVAIYHTSRHPDGWKQRIEN